MFIKDRNIEYKKSFVFTVEVNMFIIMDTVDHQSNIYVRDVGNHILHLTLSIMKKMMN